MFHQLRVDGGKEFYPILGKSYLVIFEVARILHHTDKQNLKWFVFQLLFLLFSNNFCEIKRLTCGVFFILNFVKIAFSESTKDSFINFYFLWFFRGFLCMTQNLCQTFEMIKPTVMLNIVFENFIYLFIYLFIHLHGEEKTQIFIFRICQLTDFGWRLMSA